MADGQYTECTSLLVGNDILCVDITVDGGSLCQTATARTLFRDVRSYIHSSGIRFQNNGSEMFFMLRVLFFNRHHPDVTDSTIPVSPEPAKKERPSEEFPHLSSIRFKR